MMQCRKENMMMRLAMLMTVAALTVAAAAAPGSQSDVFILNASNDSLFVRPHASIVVNLDVQDLSQKVNGCQVMLGYSSDFLTASPGCVVPGGGPWDELIYNSWDFDNGIPGEIDTAIGVWADAGVGTDADGTVAVITLTAGTREGRTNMVFRPDVPGNDTKQTFLNGVTGETIWPLKLDSQAIVIDGTPPEMNNLTTTLVSPGLVAVSVNATDAMSSLVGPPILIIASPPNAPEPNLVDAVGPVYVWQIQIADFNENYDLIILATDMAGNYSTTNGLIHIVYLNDLEQFFAQWLSTGPQLDADLDNNETVDFRDFVVLANFWQKPAPTAWPF
jgi:hypothetical protein